MRRPFDPPDEDLQVEFTNAHGARIMIYDTCCKDWTPEKKRAADERIMDIYVASQRRKILQRLEAERTSKG